MILNCIFRLFHVVLKFYYCIFIFIRLFKCNSLWKFCKLFFLDTGPLWRPALELNGLPCVNKVLLYFTLLHFTSLHFTSLHFTSLHFTLLHFTLLYFTLLYWGTSDVFGNIQSLGFPVVKGRAPKMPWPKKHWEILTANWFNNVCFLIL